MYTRILVGTDLSADADRAVTVAHQLAKRSGAKLAVCHVMPSLQQSNMLFPQAVGPTALALADFERRAGEAVSERVQNLLGAEGQAVEIFVESGADYAELVSRAEAFRADLVVVASHGHTGMKRALLGGVSDKVVRYAHSSVLVVRPGDHAGPVVAATDLSDASIPAIETASEEARSRGKELVVVHAIDTLPFVAGGAVGTPFGVFGGYDAGTAAAVVTTARAALDAKLAEKNIAAKGESLEGPATATIVRRAEELDASLLVVATHGRTGLRRALLGSVAESVVRHAPCSTLVVRRA
ncbi:MAG TPA: universal stress protein [Labilithrix sp.]|nr:universal stress protein [Labilithrix sp.]